MSPKTYNDLEDMRTHGRGSVALTAVASRGEAYNGIRGSPLCVDGSTVYLRRMPLWYSLP